MVVGLEILIVFKVAVALEQSETARILVRQRRDAHPLGVDQRPPQPLATAALQQQAVGIVHFGAEIAMRRP